MRACLLLALGLIAGCAGAAREEIEKADRAAAIAADEVTPRCKDPVSCDGLFEQAVAWAAARPDRQVLNIKREKGRFLLVRGNGTALAAELIRSSDGGGYFKTDVVCTELWKSACTPLANATRKEFGEAMGVPP